MVPMRNVNKRESLSIFSSCGVPQYFKHRQVVSVNNPVDSLIITSRSVISLSALQWEGHVEAREFLRSDREHNGQGDNAQSFRPATRDENLAANRLRACPKSQQILSQYLHPSEAVITL
jgi:hypothetical protein